MSQSVFKLPGSKFIPADKRDIFKQKDLVSYSTPEDYKNAVDEATELSKLTKENFDIWKACQKTESGKSEFKNIIKRQPARPGQKDLAEHIIPYGELNAFPLVLAQLVQESGTASSCISTITDFLSGGGLSDTNVENMP